MKQDTEFYIGWQAEVPPGFARTIRRTLIGLCLLVPAVALLIVVFQSGFSGSTFEFGKKTVLEGVFNRNPVPFISIENGSDLSGKQVFQKILLVGPGKRGFDAVFGDQNIPDGARVKMSGFLIYHDGKAGMEVKSIDIRPKPETRQPEARNLHLGVATLRGEITDPKCLFGVMKPGFSKPHRDCAVRCISGGIPPVLKVANENGETEYYLLVGPRGEALNDRLRDFVADAVQVCGRIEQEDDWLVLYADPATMRRIDKETLNPGPLCN